MKWHRLYKESKEMKSVTVKVVDDDYPYPHKFNVGDDVFVLAPTDGSDFDENYNGDFVHLLGKLLKIYETKSSYGKGNIFMGDVKVYEYNKVYDGEIGMDIVPDFIYDKPQKFIVRFKYSHRTDDEQEFTARSKEEAKDKFNKWASDMECSEDFDFQFIDAEEEQQA